MDVLVSVESLRVVISELLSDDGDLVLVKNFLPGKIFVGIFEPFVLQNLTHLQSLFGVRVQQTTDQVFGVLRDFVFQIVLGVFDLSVQLFHVVCFEGNSAVEHCE